MKRDGRGKGGRKIELVSWENLIGIKKMAF
jgi:hypothetical protein